jgi:hypothetical protein
VHVINRLAKTSERNPARALAIWRLTVAAFGPNATAEQVMTFANIGGEPEVLADATEDAKRCASAIRKAIKDRDQKAARQALAIWRATVYAELDRIAKGTP